MLTGIWFTPGYTFANFWFLVARAGRTPLPKNKLRAGGRGGEVGAPSVHCDGYYANPDE